MPKHVTHKYYASLHFWNIETLHLEFGKAREPTSSSPLSTNSRLFSVRRLEELYTKREKKKKSDFCLQLISLKQTATCL